MSENPIIDYFTITNIIRAIFHTTDFDSYVTNENQQEITLHQRAEQLDRFEIFRNVGGKRFQIIVKEVNNNHD